MTSLLYFSSPRSGPGRRVEAFLDHVLQERHNHEAFERRNVDVDRESELARRFGVDVVPTIVVLEQGDVARRIEGRVSVPALRDALAPWLH